MRSSVFLVTKKKTPSAAAGLLNHNFRLTKEDGKFGKYYKASKESRKSVLHIDENAMKFNKYYFPLWSEEEQDFVVSEIEDPQDAKVLWEAEWEEYEERILPHGKTADNEQETLEFVLTMSDEVFLSAGVIKRNEEELRNLRAEGSSPWAASLEDVDWDKMEDWVIEQFAVVKRAARETFSWEDENGNKHDGAEAIIGFQLHLDESAPHIHFQINPLMRLVDRRKGGAGIDNYSLTDKGRKRKFREVAKIDPHRMEAAGWVKQEDGSWKHNETGIVKSDNARYVDSPVERGGISYRYSSIQFNDWKKRNWSRYQGILREQNNQIEWVQETGGLVQHISKEERKLIRAGETAANREVVRRKAIVRKLENEVEELENEKISLEHKKRELSEGEIEELKGKQEKIMELIASAEKLIQENQEAVNAGGLSPDQLVEARALLAGAPEEIEKWVAQIRKIDEVLPDHEKSGFSR